MRLKKSTSIKKKSTSIKKKSTSISIKLKKLTGSQRRKFAFTLNMAIIHIISSYNNTILTIKDRLKQVLFVTSTGVYGFKHTKKGTPFAAYIMASKVFQRITIKHAKIYIQGLGPGKDAVLRVIYDMKINVIYMRNLNKLPHNGCKSPKKRRV
uniref:ribosomal protein S11 n=1 Tax=Hydnora triceps TaxID=2952647 RepID=UPI002113FA73|nr:ribosomal protein S11 [Hydnora triceps]USN93670.1 ribosomal protein S11 [Hydnora triceps]